MKIIKNKELKAKLQIAMAEVPAMIDVADLPEIFEQLFIAGYEAAIAERAKFDEQNGVIVKDIGEL